MKALTAYWEKRKPRRVRSPLGMWREAIIADAKVTDGGWYHGAWLTLKDIKAAEDRWKDRCYATGVRDYGDFISYQCGGCRFFAATGSDWGICCNAASPHDGAMTFEHGGCDQHSSVKQGG
jgi:hypothetical protein